MRSPAPHGGFAAKRLAGLIEGVATFEDFELGTHGTLSIRFGARCAGQRVTVGGFAVSCSELEHGTVFATQLVQNRFSASVRREALLRKNICCNITPRPTVRTSCLQQSR